MHAFIANNVVPTVPVDQRVRRWLDLADQGAPFKFLHEVAETEDEISVIESDKNGNRIALILHIESKPRLMIQGIQLVPAFRLEGVSPELGKWTDLNSLAKKLLAKTHSPGIGIAVMQSGTTRVAVAGVRKINTSDAVQANDVWSIGSIGKSICSTVIGRLIEQGKLRWEETLKQAMPDIPMSDGYERVTLEQVMHHRGGIPADLGFTRPEVQRIIGKTTVPLAIRDAYVRDILSRKPSAGPDSRFIYSNAGYALLSHIAELTAQKPYEALVRELVFKPLGLTHSFTGIDALPKARPSGHFESAKSLKVGDMSGPMEYMFAGAGGGMFMSVGDLAKFGQFHLNGLRGQNGMLMATTINRLHRGTPEQPGGGQLYACGWGIQSLPGIQEFHGHNGSNGTMRAELAIFPGADLVVVGIVNRGGEDEPAPGMQAVLALASRYASSK